MRKGSIANIIPIMGVFLAAILFTFQSIPITEAFGNELTDSISDLDRIAQTKSAAGLYLYNQIPMAASYSVNKAAYELGESSGGVSWSDGNTDNYAEIYVKLQEEAVENLNSDYSTGKPMQRCSLNDPEYKITLWSDARQSIKGMVYTSSPLNIKCGSSQNGEAGVNKTDFKAFFNATDNRYLVLADQTVKFYKQLEENWNNVEVEDNYSGSSRSCGYYDYSGAEAEARNKFRNDLEPGFDDATIDYPDKDGVVEEKASFEVNYEVTEESTSQGGCCDSHCHETETIIGPSGTSRKVCVDSHCHAIYKSVDTTIEPESASATTKYRDSKFKVLIDQWRNLQFRVKDYTHSFN